MNNIFTALDSGRMICLNTEVDAGSLKWNPHPTFAGVAMKHLMTGKETGGKFSMHLVRLEPCAEIGDHVHEKNWELHEVADGSGVCLLDGQRVKYEPGVAAVMPENVSHSVQAGEAGLCLLAKFMPALME